MKTCYIIKSTIQRCSAFFEARQGFPSRMLQLLKEHIIIFLFVVTAAGVVPCGIPKKRPRTSSIVQLYFNFLVL